MMASFFLCWALSGGVFNDGVVKGTVLLSEDQVDRLELFVGNNVSLASLHGKLYVINFDANLVALLSNEGKIAGVYRSAGIGPGELDGPRAAVEVGDNIGIINNTNRQLVVLTRDLEYVANKKIDFSAKFINNSSETDYFAHLLGDKKQIGVIDRRTFEVTKKFFGITYQRDSQGMPIGRTVAYVDGRFVFHFFSTLTRDDPSYHVEVFETGSLDLLNLSNPSTTLRSPEIETDIIEPVKGLPNHLGVIIQAVLYDKHYVVQIMLEGANDATLFCYDIYSKEDGGFLARHISDIVLLNSPAAKDHYFMHGGKIYRLTHLEP